MASNDFSKHNCSKLAHSFYLRQTRMNKDYANHFIHDSLYEKEVDPTSATQALDKPIQ